MIPEANGRRYRSKKLRPCDICRTRKVQCKYLPRDGDVALCEMCVRLGRRCTFVQGPPQRRYRGQAGEGDSADGTAAAAATDSDSRPAAGTTNTSGNAMPGASVPGHSPLGMSPLGMSPLGMALPSAVQQQQQQQHAADQMSVSAFADGMYDTSPRSAALDLSTMNWWATLETPPPMLPVGLGNMHGALASGFPLMPDVAAAGVLANISASPAASTTPPQQPLPPHGGPPLASETNGHMRQSSFDTVPWDPASANRPSPEDALGHQQQPQQQQQQQQHGRISGPSSTVATWPAEFALESRRGHSNQWLGLSGESDPYFLRHYFYNEFDTYPMFHLHYRKVTDDALVVPPDNARPTHATATSSLVPSRVPVGPMPVQFVLADESIWREDVHAAEAIFNGGSTEESDAALLSRLVPHDLAKRLLGLYARYFHPRYPVLSLHDLDRIADLEAQQGAHGSGSGGGDHAAALLSFPVGLRSAVYALAAPFTFLDDELSITRGYQAVPSGELWALAQRSFHRANRLSHISSLQLCLLLLQQPPHSYVAAEPPSFWALSCTALAIAENLGLGLDPSDWRLPRYEVILRRRLWWMVHATHIWQAIVFGRPSHIHSDNWDVAPLQADDFETACEGADMGDRDRDRDRGYLNAAIRASIGQHVPICRAACELSTIAADVLREFYTVRANRSAPSLSTLLARAQPLRTRIGHWRQTLPLLAKPASSLTADEFAQGAALRLSHLTLELLIFRALLRPLTLQAITAAESACEPVSTIFDNGYACAKAVVDMVGSLKAAHFASSWPSYVRHQLCYVSTFLLMSLAQSHTTALATRYLTLLDQWRLTLRIQARAWPMARLAAMRLDAITWKGVASVVHAAGPDSPAFEALREQNNRLQAGPDEV